MSLLRNPLGSQGGYLLKIIGYWTKRIANNMVFGGILVAREPWKFLTR
jgi:hypothetical protein